jgi:hypothetical protein
MQMNSKLGYLEFLSTATAVSSFKEKKKMFERFLRICREFRSLFVRAEVVIPATQTLPTHKEMSTQVNIGRQISNRLRDVVKDCIVASGSRLRVIPLWIPPESVEFAVLVGWNVWHEGASHCTNKLLYLFVTPHDIRVEVCRGYGDLVPFTQPYFTNTSPSGVEKVVADVGKYIRDYYAVMGKGDKSI